jgi:hypothetical protein
MYHTDRNYKISSYDTPLFNVMLQNIFCATFCWRIAYEALHSHGQATSPPALTHTHERFRDPRRRPSLSRFSPCGPPMWFVRPAQILRDIVSLCTMRNCDFILENTLRYVESPHYLLLCVIVQLNEEHPITIYVGLTWWILGKVQAIFSNRRWTRCWKIHQAKAVPDISLTTDFVI